MCFRIIFKGTVQSRLTINAPVLVSGGGQAPSHITVGWHPLLRTTDIHMFASPITLISHGCVHVCFKHVWCINVISCVRASERPFSSGTEAWKVFLESRVRRLRPRADRQSLGKAATWPLYSGPSLSAVPVMMGSLLQGLPYL